MSEPIIPEVTDQPTTVHESAIRMQEEFARTGSYDARDIDRVLGDPRESVRIVVPESYSLDTTRNVNCCFTSLSIDVTP